jgi:hemerythrin-like domain-containing protein
MLRDPSLIPLSHQHQHGLALCVMMRRSLAANASPENVAAWARKTVDRYEVELANHFEIEEQVLFPACGALPIITELVAEHRQLEGYVAQLRTEPSGPRLEEFCSLLTSHIRREENELFEQIQRELPLVEMDRVGAEIDRRAVRVCL